MRIVGLLGVALFLSLFLLTFGVPEALEKSAMGFVKAQVEREVVEKYDNALQSDLASNASVLAEKLGFEQKQIEQNLKDKLPEKIASIIASMCGYDCEKKKALAQSITAGYLDRIASLNIAQNTLGDIVKGKYLEIVSNLRLDLRIFLGSNTLIFAILLAISLLKPQAVLHLFVPGVLLLVSTLVSSYIYIFGQDWFYTILYNDYIGVGYLVYIGVIFGFLMDITFNHGRVTTEIINGILNAIGSALSALPC